MISQLIVLLITAHILSDYALQGPKMVEEKKEMKLWVFIKHILGYFVLALILAINWFSWSLILVLIIQTLFHGFIDYLKIKLELKKPNLKFESDIFDILLHILIIWLTVMIFRPSYLNIILPAKLKILIPPLLGYKFYIYLSSVTFLLRGGTSLVCGILLKVRKDNKNNKEDNTGRLIGNIERILIFILILYNDLAAIGFIVAAKSIARFEEMKDKKFAEYYIIGTLTSALIAIITGKLTIYLINILNY